MPRTDTIIELAYSAAADPTAWPDAVRMMSACFGAISAGIYVGDMAERRVQLISLHGIDTDYVRSYVERFLCENPWSLPVMQAPGRVRTDTSLDEYYRDPGYYRRTTLFKEWMEPQDFIYTLGVNLTAEENRQTKVFLYRSKHAGPYSAQDIARFRRLARHLTNALMVADRFAAIRRKADDARHVLDCLHFGVVLLDDRGHVLEANSFAERLLERRDGLAALRGRVTALHGPSGRALAAAVRGAAAMPKGGDDAPVVVYVERTGGAQPLSVTALPLPRDASLFDVRRAAVVLLINDPSTAVRVPIERLRQRFSLTRSEARIAAGLVQGLSLRDAADEAGLTYETARWYMKSTFQKTGASRQAELVRLLLSDPGLLAPHQ